MVEASHTTLAARLALTTAVLALLYGLVRLAAHAALALTYPYGMDYGEGVIWQQMIGIVAGRGYAPLGSLPAFVFQYPPVYHLVTAGTAASLGLDPLFAGRLVSLVSTLVAAALAGRIAAIAIGTGEDRRVRTIAGLIAALAFATLPLLLTSALLMQIDMLAMALTLAGTLLAIRAVDRPGMAVWAGAVFALALYTRQTCLPAPAASFLVLLLVRPRAAWTLLGTAIGTCLLALGLIRLAEGDHFLVNILAYNMNRIAWDHAPKLFFVLLANTVPIAIGVVGAVVVWRRLDLGRWRALRHRLASESGLAASAVVLLTLALKTLMLPMILKSGANDNYLIDWFSGIAILIGIAVVPVVGAALRQPANPSLLLLVLVAIGLPVHMADPPLLPDFAQAGSSRVALDQLVARVRASPKPVVSDDMVLLLRAGKPVIWEPAIIAELGSSGVYDQTNLIAHVRHGDFGFFVTHGDRGDLMFDQRFNPAVASAMDAAYPRREHVGSLTLRLPRD
jgi:hypothetical protein